MEKKRVLGIVLILIACGAGAYLLGSQGTVPDSGGESQRKSDRVSVTVATSELAAGENRLVLGITGRDNVQVRGADVDLTISRQDGPGKSVAAPAKYVGDEFGGRAAYVAAVNFSSPGQWQAEVQVENRDFPRQKVVVDLPVAAESAVPSAGEKAVPSKTPTASLFADKKELCSADPPCSMHDHSIAESIERRRPLVVLFAAPAQCTSGLCGPLLGIVEEAKKIFEKKVDFVHIEVFRPGTSAPVDAVKEWEISSEPWIFLVGDDGRIFSKYEGPATLKELRADISKMLSK